MQIFFHDYSRSWLLQAIMTSDFENRFFRLLDRGLPGNLSSLSD